MRIVLSPSFKRDYQRLPQLIQKQADRKLGLFSKNIRHPSLRVKRVKGYKNLWEGSITMNYRFLFRVDGDTSFLLYVGTHRLLDRL